MDNIIAEIIILSICYVLGSALLTASPFMSLANVYMGVAIDKAERKSDTVRKIVRKYFISCLTILILGISLLILISINMPKLLNSEFIVLLFILQVALHLLAYSISFTKIKAYKKSLGKPSHSKTTLLLDTNFISRKNKIIDRYVKISFITILINIILMVYAVVNYKNVPDLLPVHFNAMGVADRFTDKSYFSVLTMPILGLILSALLIYILRVSFYSPSKFSKVNLDECQDIVLRYVAAQCKSITGLNFSIVLMFIPITIGTINGANLSLSPMIIACILLIISLIYLIYASVSYKKELASFKTDTDFHTVEDEEDFWIWGIFYNNPNDARGFVTDRSGLGYTFNLGSRSGRTGAIIMLIILILTLSLCFVL